MTGVAPAARSTSVAIDRSVAEVGMISSVDGPPSGPVISIAATGLAWSASPVTGQLESRASSGLAISSKLVSTSFRPQ